MKYFPPSQWGNMRKVLAGEGAHGNPNTRGPIYANGRIGNKNGSIDYGCFQMNFKHPPAGWNDPDTNAKWAYDLWMHSGGNTQSWARWCSADNMKVVSKAC